MVGGKGGRCSDDYGPGLEVTERTVSDGSEVMEGTVSGGSVVTEGTVSGGSVVTGAASDESVLTGRKSIL